MISTRSITYNSQVCAIYLANNIDDEIKPLLKCDATDEDAEKPVFIAESQFAPQLSACDIIWNCKGYDYQLPAIT